MKNKKVLGSLLLTTAAIIWGSSFVFMKSAIDFIDPFSILLLRFSGATILMVLIFFRYLKNINKKQIVMGAITGMLLILAYIIQTKGLAYTTPSKNAFLSAIYCILMPFIIWLFDKRRPSNYHLLAGIICFIGIGFVSLNGYLLIASGDILSMISGIFFAFHMFAVKRFGEKMHPITLTILQFGFAAIFSLFGTLIFEDITKVTDIPIDAMIQIGYLIIFATTIAMFFQNMGQKLVSACSSAIILSLESVFSIVFAILLYGEVIHLQMWIGFTCIFLAIIISETKLSFLKRGEV